MCSVLSQQHFAMLIAAVRDDAVARDSIDRQAAVAVPPFPQIM
jgi:hypothetical protein